MTLVTMSEKEIGRLGVLRDIDAGRMTAGAAMACSRQAAGRLLGSVRSCATWIGHIVCQRHNFLGGC